MQAAACLPQTGRHGCQVKFLPAVSRQKRQMRGRRPLLPL